MHLDCGGLPFGQVFHIRAILQKQMPLPVGGVQPVYKIAPPFLKGPVRLGHFQAAAGRLCFGLRGLPVEREGKAKISI